MKRVSGVLFTLAALYSYSPAIGQPDQATCGLLLGQWDSAEKDIAEIYARGISDDSAPRATLREMETANALATANMALQLMRDHHCPLPRMVPSFGAYAVPAMQCRTAQLRGETNSPSCDRSRWQRLGDETREQ